MDNKSRTTLSDVREDNYNQINFINFFDYISNKNASVYVNDIKLDDMTYSLIEKEAVIRIKPADEESHLHKLTLKHDNIEENIILDNKVNSEISKKYNFKYDEDKLCYEFTINPIETSFDITTVFRDGKPMQNTHESMEEAGITDITINNATVSNAERKPYPAVFLKTPEFFDVLGNTEGEGNELSSPINIGKEDLVKSNIIYRKNGNVIYNGEAYSFESKLKLEAFNVNIKVEVSTKNEKSASMVRRLFYDKINPFIDYKVYERELDSNIVKIKVRSRDNSFKLSLYNGDSLIGTDDKTSISYIEGKDGNTTQIVTQIEVPLNEGQNSIKITAIDLAGNKSEKTIYIYIYRAKNNQHIKSRVNVGLSFYFTQSILPYIDRTTIPYCV